MIIIPTNLNFSKKMLELPPLATQFSDMIFI